MNHEELREQLGKELGNTNLVTSLSKAPKVTGGLSSGSMLLNLALSGGPLVGFEWGRIVEIYGPEQSGKTTMALHAILEAQRLERQSDGPVPALFVDAEHALDVQYAADIGIDLDSLSISQPDSGEQALTIVEKAIKTGFRLIVVDSVAALSPKAEIDGEMGDSHMGLMARLMSQAMRKINGICMKHGAVLIFVNQIRMKLGVVFGNPETTTGGKALRFYSSYRLEVRSPRSGKKTGKKSLTDESDDEESVELGTTARVKVVKNKCFPPYRTAEVYIEYGVGIDRYRDALTFILKVGGFRDRKSSKTGKTTKVIDFPSQGKSYTFNKALELFRENPEVQQDVLDKIAEIDEELE